MTLKHTPCDCEAYRRIESACGDLIAERTTLRNEVAGYKWRAEEAEKTVAALTAERDQYAVELKAAYKDLDNLRAENDMLQAAHTDAERYRIIMCHATRHVIRGREYLKLPDFRCFGMTNDEAVDALRNKEE